jgi:hypothetical protein
VTSRDRGARASRFDDTGGAAAREGRVALLWRLGQEDLMGKRFSLCALAAVATLSTGCATQDIPQAHRGRLFARSGLLSLYMGGGGLDGKVLDPGTKFLGIYDELRLVDCATTTIREPLDTLTRDGVHFGFDIVTRFSADCSDEGVVRLMSTLHPDKNGETISAQLIYETYIKPAIGEAARESVSPLRANDLNDKQAEVAKAVKDRFVEFMKTREITTVKIYEVNVSHLQFPPALDTANLERAAQAVLRDKAIAERARVEAETETMAARTKLAEQEAAVEIVKIEKIGAALRNNPAYVQFEFMRHLPDIYRDAGQRGNMILAAPNPLNLPLPVPSLAPPAPVQPPPSTALPKGAVGR